MKKSRMFRKSIVAAIAALCLTAPMAMMPMTASAYTITVMKGSETSTLSYDAYQIFSGVYSNDVLGSIQWGSGIDSTKTADLLTAIKAIKDGENTPFSGCVTAEDVALKLGEYTTHDVTVVKSFAKVVADYLSGTKITGNNGSINVTDVGYYLVQNSGTVSGDNSATRNILRVVGGDVTVSIKTSVPKIEKKVQENTNITDDDIGITDTDYQNKDYNDVADYNIGDDVPFLDIGTLPSDIDEYDEYYYQIVDTPGDKFTPNITPGEDGVVEVTDEKNDIVVKINGKEVYVDGDNVKVEYVDTDDTDDEPDTIKVTFENIKDVYEVKEDESQGEKITVDEKSHVTVEYTAKLDEDADIGLSGQTSEVKLNFSNDPNEDYKSEEDTDGPDSIGTTPPDKVIVFTYELDITKKLATSEGYILAGEGEVGFKLYKKDEDVKYYAQITNGKVSGWTNDSNDSNDTTTEIKTDTNGIVSFVGLDDGEYWIEESTTPSGYNSIPDTCITIDATTANGQDWGGTASSALTDVDLKEGNIYHDGTEENNSDNTDGTVRMIIHNERGSSLPSTGGIGTTIFYLGGGSMAAVAGIYLITKKRMKNSEEE